MDMADKDKTLKNRKLKIKYKPVFYYDGTGADNGYYPSSFNPGIVEKDDDTEPSMPGVVDSNGNIDLSDMPKNDDYNDNVDITIVLDDSELKDCNGKKVSAVWSDDTRGYEYTRADGTDAYTGYGWFCAQDSTASDGLNPQSPLVPLPKGLSFERVSDTELLLRDYTGLDGDSYGFVVAFMVPDMQDYWVPCDPVISTKGESNH